MPPRMTSAAWQHGFKNALICGVGIVGVLAAFTVAISAIFQQSLRDSGAIAFYVVWALTLVVFILSWLIGKNKSGPVLLDCGPHPTKGLFLVNAVLFAFMGVGGGFASFANQSEGFGIASALFGFTLPVYWVIMGFGQLQIRENGIWQYWSLLNWQKIESYEWKGEEDSTLMLQFRTKLPILGRSALPVPIEHKDAVTDLLQKHCPVEGDA